MQTEIESNGDSLPIWRAQVPNRPLTGLTVLVVEDSRYASEAVRLLCLRSGARIRRADCLKSAARHLQAYRPDVAIVDLGLPDGDGTELIRRIAQGPGAPVTLGISGEPSKRDEAIAAGAVDFLAKPIESLAAFQQTVLTALPDDIKPRGLRILPDDIVTPDNAALRDDLAHVAEVLASAQDTTAIEYISRFLEGVARSARDQQLADAAAALGRDYVDGHGLSTDLARISGLLHDRLKAS